MFAFAFVGDSDERGGCIPCVEAMLDAWPYAKPQHRRAASAPHAATEILSWVVSARDRQAAPIWDADRCSLTSGDVRLYNRAELTRQLGADSSEDEPDLALVYRAYLRWGPDVARHLNGDFAFCVWDERARSLFAIRDHLGVRPLFYRIEGGRILLGTDVAQIVRVARGRLVLDANTVAEHLLRTARRSGCTYFRDISYLPPGYRLKFERGRVQRERHWEPPPQRRGISYPDECAEVRAIFIDAVQARLESDKPIVAHSSGGFDSSTIVMVANATYEGDESRPPLVLASARTPGMPCDDGRYMDAVAKRVRFEGHSWNALEGSPVDHLLGFTFGDPDPGRGLGGGAPEDLRLIEDRGAGVLLTGLAGDGVVFSFGITRDLARNGRFLELLIQASSSGQFRDLLRTLGRASLGILRPDLAVTALERWNTRATSGPTIWMGPLLRELCPLPPAELDVERSWDSHMACETWVRLTSPAMASTIHGMVRWGARAGAEVRIPYLDVRLVERILEIPWERRFPRGDARRLGRDALGDLLPVEFQSRREQGSWTPVWERHARLCLPSLARLLREGEWLSAPFVLRDQASKLLEVAQQDTAQGVRILNEFGVLEAWMRYLLRTVPCAVY